ncbi:hypothetical protein QE152_g29430 [Popillia japonica]|uniref:EGF-like domain-containing protein n=1 Tax=Popillia japonica TaxID=7064 RepID=A0AAW1JHQ2_POPJA
MIVLKLIWNVFTFLYVLASVSGCHSRTALPTKCDGISCLRYPSTDLRCPRAYAFDPINHECIPKCEQSCNKGICTYCTCYAFDYYDFMHDIDPYGKKCERISKAITCNTKQCSWDPIKTCNNYFYVINPFDAYECIPRCTNDSCKNGWCSGKGYCICNLGYHPDPINPMTCIRIPNCNDVRATCKHVTQEMTTLKTSTETSIADCSHYKNNTNNNNSTNSCVCTSSNHDINQTINATKELQQNQTDNEMLCPEKIETNIFNLYIPILASIIAILLIVVCILTFIIIRIKKQASMRKEEEDTYGGSNYYSSVTYQKKSNDVLVENLEFCSRHQPTDHKCPRAYAFDPINKVCIPKCEKSCDKGVCTFCTCYSSYDNHLQLSYDIYGKRCERISKTVTCDTKQCPWEPIEICINVLYVVNPFISKTVTCDTKQCPWEPIEICINVLYVVNPFDVYECIPRCSNDSCKNGRCSLEGYCICKPGYHPDPINPMTCIEIPNVTQEIITPKTRTGTPIADCSHYKNNTNNNNSTNSCVCTSSNNEMLCPEKMVTNIFKLYIPIFASIIAILLIVVFILTFIIIRIKKQASVRKEEEDTYGGSNYYSSVTYQKKSTIITLALRIRKNRTMC